MRPKQQEPEPTRPCTPTLCQVGTAAFTLEDTGEKTPNLQSTFKITTMCPRLFNVGAIMASSHSTNTTRDLSENVFVIFLGDQKADSDPLSFP